MAGGREGEVHGWLRREGRREEGRGGVGVGMYDALILRRLVFST